MIEIYGALKLAGVKVVEWVGGMVEIATYCGIRGRDGERLAM